ncbi:hypothetical protein IQ276_003835 [Desmonostoc muscorum LEGE 12446]|uniref:Uncharacterized protein n=1 Tax=Desmonostoc muscorum LEGE 12446 TaxID=1828758 RepID=A0A8J7CXY9_DESMC|nr:hypothetical protein [Desmonostoc muscorum]MCF2145599.1 hypothetical protein [Desmonostoc muscorum LEGE 12446]
MKYSRQFERDYNFYLDVITSKKTVEIKGKIQYLPDKFLNYGYELIKGDEVVAVADGWTNPSRAKEEANKKLQTLATNLT